MRDQLIGQTFLIIPFGALPGEPQIAIGAAVPSQVIAYYAPDTVISGFIYEYQNNVFYWTVSVNPELGDPFIATGVTGFNLSDALFTRELHRVTLASGSGGLAVMTFGLEGQGAGSAGSGAAGGGSLLKISGLGTELDIVNEAGLSVGDGNTSSFLTVAPNSVLNQFGDMISPYGLSMPRGIVGGGYATAGTLITTVSASEIAIPALTWVQEPEITLDPGRLARISVTCGIFNNAGGNDSCTLRVRKGSGTVAGTRLGFWRHNMSPPGTTGIVDTATLHSYVSNTTAASITTKLSLTIARNTNNIAIFGDTSIVCQIVVEDIGAAAEHPEILAASL